MAVFNQNIDGKGIITVANSTENDNSYFQDPKITNAKVLGTDDTGRIQKSTVIADDTFIGNKVSITNEEGQITESEVDADVLKYITEQQTKINQERLECYETNIGTYDNGVIPQKQHMLSTKFPIHFNCSYKENNVWKDVLISHSIDDNGNIDWSLTSPYTINNQAKITLVGKTGLATATERELINAYAYGIKFTNTAVGMTAPVRVGNMTLHKTLPIHNSMKGCVWDKDKGIQYYLDEHDWSKKEDGTDSVLNGNDGDVMVHVCKYYIRYIVEGDACEVYVSLYKLSDLWQEIPEMLIAAFKGMLVSNRWRSIVNMSVRGGNGSTSYDTGGIFKSTMGKCRTNYRRSAMRTYCRNNNTELMYYEYRKSTMYWLYVIEYCNFNSQAEFNPELTEEGFHQGGLGRGLSDHANWTSWNNTLPIVPNGYGIGTGWTDNAGNSFGDNTHGGNYTSALTITPEQLGYTLTNSQKTQTIISYRGLFDPMGHIWENLDGCICIDANVYTTISKEAVDYLHAFDSVATSSTKATTKDWLNNGFELIAQRPLTNGYGTSFVTATNRIELIPAAVKSSGGTDGTYDYWYQLHNTNIGYTILIGGSSDSGSPAGLGYLASDNWVGYATVWLGGRAFKII